MPGGVSTGELTAARLFPATRGGEFPCISTSSLMVKETELLEEAELAALLEVVSEERANHEVKVVSCDADGRNS